MIFATASYKKSPRSPSALRGHDRCNGARMVGDAVALGNVTNHGLSPIRRGERVSLPFQDELERLAKELAEHEVYANPYFDLLRNSKFTRETYALHRANFFYRTELTVKAIAHVCARAARENDAATLILFSFILNEECGSGKPEHCHAVLMEGAHNLFGEVAFGLAPLPVDVAGGSPHIAEGTKRYRERIGELSGASYQRLLGVAMALESHAEKMLTHCRTAFRAHADRFDRAEFVRSVEVYFNVHLDGGVEERHAADARECVRRNCRTREDFAEVAYGAREMLAVQNAMWKDLHERSVEIASWRDA